MVEIIKVFILGSNKKKKKNVNFKHNELNHNIYVGPTLGKYAADIINESYEQYIKMISDHSMFNCIKECECNDDLPCIHMIHSRIVNNKKPLFTEDDIPKLYFVQPLTVANAKYNEIITL